MGNEITPISNETALVQSFSDLELVSADRFLQSAANDYTQVPLSELAAVGAGISSLLPQFRTVTTRIIENAGANNLYEAFDPDTGAARGLQYMFKGTNDYMGSLMKDGKTAQAHFREVKEKVTEATQTAPIDPTMMFMTVALMCINKKLDAISDTQQKMMEFLENDKRAELEGALTFLIDALRNYKFNWDNEMYKNNMHLKTQDIKQTAEHNIAFYRKRIDAILSKRELIASRQKVQQKMDGIQSCLSNYQLSLYLFGFSSFLEVMFLGNFAADYLNSVSKTISQHALQYITDYTRSYDALETDYNKSIESVALGGIAKVSGKLGNAIAKAPVISKGPVDEALIKSQELLDKFSSDGVAKRMRVFIESKDSTIRPFIEMIDSINTTANEPTEYYFDENNLYLRIVA